MKVIPATEAKTNFGALLDSTQREPVTISKKGRQVAVLMSAQEFEEQEALKLYFLKKEVNKGLKQLDNSEIIDKLELQSLIKELT